MYIIREEEHFKAQNNKNKIIQHQMFQESLPPSPLDLGVAIVLWLCFQAALGVADLQCCCIAGHLGTYQNRNT